jgi:hypothetical protein
VQLDEGGEAKSEAVAVSLGKNRSQGAVQDESRFEIGAGGGELNRAYAITEVEPAAVIGRAEEAMQTPAQICSLAHIGFGLRIFSAEEENGGSSRGEGEGFGVTGRVELETLG